VGISAFRDEESIRKGDQWMKRLETALQGCRAFIVLIGSEGVQRWVSAEVQVALSRHLSPRDDAKRLAIFPILFDSADRSALPPFLKLFQAEKWNAAEPLSASLREAIREGITRFDPAITIEKGICPFLGLRAFGQEHAKWFFGRRKETLEALGKLGDQLQTNPEHLSPGNGATYKRWLQVEGDSGAGKSSLVAAGMLPLIERGWLWARTGFEHWTILRPMLPGRKPEPLPMAYEAETGPCFQRHVRLK
jgi:hypothetical protein